MQQKHAAGVLLILTGSFMIIAAVMPARLMHTWIDDSVRMRETAVGQQCEILAHSVLEYSELGDFAYVGEHCCLADTQVGRFCAIANQVRIGAPSRAEADTLCARLERAGGPCLVLRNGPGST